MKKIYFLAIAALVSFSACKKDVKSFANVDEDINYHEEVAFPDAGIFAGIPVNSPIPAIDTAFPTNYQSYLTQYNTSPNKVISTKMKELNFRMTTPPGQTFDFIDTMRVYVFGNGLPTKLVGYKYPVPKGLTELDLDIVDEDLKEYFLHDSVHVRLSGHINALPPNGTRMLINTTFHLFANPLN